MILEKWLFPTSVFVWKIWKPLPISVFPISSSNLQRSVYQLKKSLFQGKIVKQRNPSIPNLWNEDNPLIKTLAPVSSGIEAFHCTLSLESVHTMYSSGRRSFWQRTIKSESISICSKVSKHAYTVMYGTKKAFSNHWAFWNRFTYFAPICESTNDRMYCPICSRKYSVLSEWNCLSNVMQPATNGGPSSGSDNLLHSILPIVEVCVCACAWGLVYDN